MVRTNSSGLLLQKLTHPHPHLSLICPQPQPLSPCRRTHLIKCPNLSSSHSNPRTRSTSFFRPATRWDSDAETSDGNNKYPGEKRRWWSDEDLPDSDAAVEPGGLAWDEVIDSLWVIKVFKSFGWFLPLIIPSFNLFTDPKAFILMVSAVTLVQSLVFASEKLLSRTENRPRRKAKAKTKTRTSGSNNETKNQTRVAANEDSIKRSNFGGWDDLDEPGYVQSRPSRSRERPMKKAKMSRKQISDTPLLLRLLISVFPFLSSWTRML